ncbi:hypothetical protein NFI95_05865 [Acetobacteraceae bacterium KSS8]|uniref:Uncharacterized protein n=1 Tax=Endosaccharibacter trunci TaxID=2812733 RepID=A0ABT1W514_9PROT|nr:hypothetical protein [Acetobacteraceae bacterium KSS8]
MAERTVFATKGAYKDGCVAVQISLRGDGHFSDTVKVEGRTEISTSQARAFAQRLLTAADAEDARQQKKDAAAARRSNWRQREIAVGRMIVYG